MKLSSQLVNFIIAQRGTFDFVLTPDSSLQKDLGIYGDDALDFMIDFFKEFNVDSNGINLSNYFEDEGLFMNYTLSTSTKKPLSIGDLQRFIDSGKFSV